ncbi:MAG: branched-chain amino acid ABC transporter permease [Actinomycetota bacterium]|nr:branched-chain amino acid ABC transporter permease [Actinomycetota bacterium]MEC7665843.1 branched-chain amino acid ABC transporter permease [Actinomycetota bacterium]MEC8018237.1 branched-chain amino acid ABC transporter permease [Actinomycetota bacterium]MEC8464702.1 branched-chain amino acid ABC transporter permease [Actinomycetota bacterium]MEC8485517.1 branched-chain amino acid ABC transporter permease [Actinomycetota bacterium]
MDWGAIIQNSFRGFIGEPFIYFSLAAMGLNMHYGYTGLLNFGQAVFMAAGAYGLSMAVVTLGLNFWWGLLLGIVIFPLLLALIMGVPTLRLRADYLAIVTIAASEMFRIIARSPSLDRWTGSSDGLTAFANRFYDFNPFDKQKRYFFGLFIGNQMWVVLIGWIVLSIVVLIVWMTMRSPWGRVLRAIREDEDAARSLGKNAYWFKMQSLMIGGMFGALGGMFRAIGTQSAQPQNFITDVTFFAWVALILGGAAKVGGPIAGAAILYGILNFTDVLLRQLVENGYMPEAIMDGTQVGQVRFMMIGLGLILLAIYRPQGIFGTKEEMALDDR